MRYFIPLTKSSKRVGSIVLLLAAIASLASPAKAEGSKELTSNGGQRPYLEYRSNSFFIGNNATTGISRRTLIKVYAATGETINLGSSAVGLGAGVIQYRRPGSSTTQTCPTSASTLNPAIPIGRIPNRNAEVAGPYHPTTNTDPNAFEPCTIPVTATGIWEIEFVSPDASQGANNVQANPPAIAATGNWTQRSDSSWVAAWDVTVRNNSGIAIPGRAFADYLSLNVGDNGTTPQPLFSKVYVQTKDGYGYEVNMNGIDPFGFAFFANNKGFTDSTGNPIYRSLQLLFSGSNPSPNGIPAGYTIQRPNVPDTGNNVTHKIFFSPTGPDTLMPSTAVTPSDSTWLYKEPDQPPTPSNFFFEGIENTPGRAGTSPLGGRFKFTAPSVATLGAYTITLDINRNGTFGDGNDRVLIGTATPGLNTITWNGLDGNGNAVPASSTSYNARVELYAGEIHFPFIDPENNPNGIIIRRAKDPGSNPNAPNPYSLHFDNRNNGGTSYDYSLCATGESAAAPAPCYGTAPLVRSALGGTDSSGGANKWAGNFGDRRGMDSWTFYPSGVLNTPAQILIQEADLAVTKTDNLTSIAAGSPITYTIEIKNNGPSDVTDASVKDTMPSQLSNVTWSCTASTDSSCGTSNGTGNIDIKVNLKNGGTATITVNAIVNLSATGTLQNTATVLRPNDVNDPTDPNRLGAGNNSATDTTTITAPAPRLRLVKRITALNAIAYTDTIDDPSDPNDDSSILWTTNYLTGRTGKSLTAADTVPVKPGDTLEYTIYFLSDGGIPAQNVTLCDLVPANTTFVANAFNGNTPTDGGTPGADSGMRLTLGSSTVYLSNGADSPDRGQFFAPGTSAPCGNNGASIVVPNGAVTVNLGNVTNATAPGTPNSFGFIRFRAKVN